MGVVNQATGSRCRGKSAAEHTDCRHQPAGAGPELAHSWLTLAMREAESGNAEIE